MIKKKKQLVKPMRGKSSFDENEAFKVITDKIFCV